MPGEQGIRLDEVDRRIVNELQGGFPICERPYSEVAQRLGIGVGDLIGRLERLLRERVLTRFGPLYNADRMGGSNVLAAMTVPEADYERVADIANAQPEVAHNYRREHSLNMWFVGSAGTPQQVEEAFCRIEAATGLAVYRFPKEKEFFVELKLRV